MYYFTGTFHSYWAVAGNKGSYRIGSRFLNLPGCQTGIEFGLNLHLRPYFVVVNNGDTYIFSFSSDHSLVYLFIVHYVP